MNDVDRVIVKLTAQVLFDNTHEIVGARIRTYLLERSRLVYQPESERNYHIFYQLLSGAPSKERKDLSLSSDPNQFAYLAGGGPTSTPIPGVDDAKEFRDTQTAHIGTVNTDDTVRESIRPGLLSTGELIAAVVRTSSTRELRKLETSGISLEERISQTSVHRNDRANII